MDNFTPEEQAELDRLDMAAGAAEARAATALTPFDVAKLERLQRQESAEEQERAKLADKRKADLYQQVKIAQAAADRAYAVDSVDAEDKSPGAGSYVIRSPGETWQAFNLAIKAAGDDESKQDLARRNFAASVIVWPNVGAEIHTTFGKFKGLAIAITNRSSELAGLFAGQRKS